MTGLPAIYPPPKWHLYHSNPVSYILPLSVALTSDLSSLLPSTPTHWHFYLPLGNSFLNTSQNITNSSLSALALHWGLWQEYTGICTHISGVCAKLDEAVKLAHGVLRVKPLLNSALIHGMLFVFLSEIPNY